MIFTENSIVLYESYPLKNAWHINFWMNKSIIYLIAFTLPLISLSQEKWSILPDEFILSGNRTFVEGEGRFGFGAGMYHAFLKGHRLSIIPGLEYNRTACFYDYEYNDKWSHNEDVTYHFNYLTIPIGLRVNFGKKINIFLESGGFVDFPLYTKTQGTNYYAFPVFDEDSVYIESGQEVFDRKISSNTSVGVYFGGGVIIPSSKVDWIIKADYKYGLTETFEPGYNSDKSRYVRFMLGVRLWHRKYLFNE